MEIISGATIKGIKNTLVNEINGDDDEENSLLKKFLDYINGIESSDFLYMYNTYGNNATGTGGIAGKNYAATINFSYNNATIIANYNGGGIEGINFNGTTKYSYNSGNVTNKQGDEKLNNKNMNRLGGICGSGHGVTIEFCYNTGKIQGIETGAFPLRSGIGGIAGFIVDNVTGLRIKEEEIGIPGYEIPIKYIGLGTKENHIRYCYSAGEITGGNNQYNNAIVGCVGVGFAFEKDADKIIQYMGNYYLTSITPNGKGARGSLPHLTSMMENQNGYIGKSENDLKEILYNWASNLRVPDTEESSIANRLVYNTVAPLEKDKGYEGYGVLWWQLEDYISLTTNMFLCQISKKDGIEEKNYKEISLAYKPSVEFNGNSLTFREIPFDCKIINPFPEDKPVSCNSCLQWKMMIKNIDYVVEGKTDFSKEADYFVDNDFKIRGKTMNLSTGTDKTISIAPVIETVADNLETKSISTVWKRKDIDIITERRNSWPSSADWGLYDENHKLIKSVKGYYELDPNDSKETFNDGKHVTITMDKGDEIVSNQPVKFYKFEYYTRTKKYNWKKVRWDYYYHGPNKVSEGTNADDVKPKAITYEAKFKVVKQADKAACNVYIPVQNLVDRIGEETARKNVLQTAKLNMEFKARLKTALLQKNISHLTAKVTLERKEKGTDNWIKVDEHINNGFTADSEKKRPFGDDYTEFDADLQKLKINDWNLKDVKYNDDLRINVDLEFKGTTEKAYIDIKNVNLDITYGPDIDED